MNITRSKLEAVLPDAITFAIASVVTLLVVGVEALIMVPVIGFFTLLNSVFKMRLKERAELEREGINTATLFNGIRGVVTDSKMSLVNAISKQVTYPGEIGVLRDSVRRIAKRISLGQDLDVAISSERISNNPDANKAWSVVNDEYLKQGHIDNALRYGYDSITRNRELKTEIALAAFPKYLVMSMVFSTILPSLAVFGFVGYSILFYSLPSLLVFSVLMLSLIPSISSIITTKISDTYAQ